ncbi:hypothetical protein [Bdellovibrio sp. GT3]|uniref:hypothetical protein n=1 Tax=Bdellovibrio sp. GT3 TaxID=3136282 RepID=UPI0030F36B12
MFGTRLSLTILLSAPSAFATNLSPGVELNHSVYSNQYPAEQLKGPVNKTQREHQVISPGQRDDLIDKAGLEKYFKDKSHYDRDMFVLRAQNYSANELAKKYPDLSKRQLVKIKNLIKVQRQ